MIEPGVILVTGGAGMIGSNLVHRLRQHGHRVIVVDNLWRGRRENLLDANDHHVIDMEHDFYDRDLALPDQLDDLLTNVDYLFHLADIVAGIGYVFCNQGSIFRQNLLINSNVVTSARRFPDIKGLIYVGTACSFPADKQTGVDAPPLREEDQYPAAPESAYGWSKLMGEYEMQLAEKEVGIPVSIPVLHNVYGAPCDFDSGRSQVIPALIQKALRAPDQPFIVWGSGEQGRAFVHVRDVIDGLIAAMERGLGKGIIQIGPDSCTRIKDIAETVADISGKNFDITYDTTRPEGDRGRCADFSKARKELGWTPRIDLREGLEELYEWISART